MRYRILPVTQLQQNCTLIVCEETGEAAVIDPGGDVQRILQLAAAEGARITKIWITHGHIDHAGGAMDLKDATGAVIEGPNEADRYWLEGLANQSRMFGMAMVRNVEPDRWLHHGDTVEVGKLRFEVLHCPGHTPGHVAFFHEPSHLVQVGDVLFAGSIGRTDFPGGSFEQLITSIVDRLFPLGDEVTFIPGHGPTSTLGEERHDNPYVGEGR